MKYPTILTIAGSDSSSGAGIQADLKTASSLGVYAFTAVTAVTAQNSRGVSGINPVSPEILLEQLSAITEETSPDAIKIGMIPDKDCALVIADFLKKGNYRNIVYDPVLRSSSGHDLSQSETLPVILDSIIPASSLLTPNIDEAELLSGRKISNLHEAEDVGKLICRNYRLSSILIKGGHLASETLTDILILQSQDRPLVTRFSHPKIHTKNTHGTGCTLSSAIASFLALGFNLTEAVGHGIDYLQKALKAGADYKIGEREGHGPLNHMFTNSYL
ncbi:MAG: bifunctional hydroxymethylpyrimidine kinase/phosphomethylpyrimidine kinase [Muribaculaceae bacterium]|nr:bifunctional hydroxymethylpyrimidine kinase/phosphomethylpyrimidine kinase [Muribaculaceae bacterium]